ncbi:MAG: hypothetical protein IJ678_05615, partial [Kiritimatiellae bacterium]|nr:hypothetical protein [Kiritimatiellia bacterium]
MKNSAFSFIKPHAMVSQPVVNAIADRLEEAGVRVSHMERIGADRLPALFDAHSGAVARVARAASAESAFGPDGRARFSAAFGEDFSAAAAHGRVLLPDAAIAAFGTDPDGLLRIWGSGYAEELAPGLFVAKCEKPCHHHHDHDHCGCGHDHDHDHGDCGCDHEARYVVNGFYPAERAPYADPAGPGVMAMVLDFDIDWMEFNDVVIGDKAPGGALEESIRGFLYDRRDALGMRIDLYDNVLHASRNAFEALCDKIVWLPPARRRDDPLLRALRAAKALP